jgi:hypothetical protein
MAGHAKSFWASVGSGKEPPHFVYLKRRPIMPAVHLDIHPFQVGYGRFAGPSIPNHPPAEALYRLEVEIRGLDRQALTSVAQVRKIAFNLFGRDI